MLRVHSPGITESFPVTEITYVKNTIQNLVKWWQWEDTNRKNK
jgi:hypothetical protein